MKRFIAVLSGLLVLPAFAEVAPIYYDEVIEYTDEEIAPADDAIVEEEVTAKINPIVQPSKVNPRSASASRNASRVVSSGSGANVSSRGATTRGVSASRTTTNATQARTGVASRSANATRGVASRSAVNTVATRNARSATGTTTATRRATVSTPTTMARASIVQTDTVNKPLYTGRVSERSSAMRARVPTVSVSSATSSATVTDTATTNMDELAQITDFCKAQYMQCMDNYCNVLDNNQGRCSCSKNLKNYKKTEEALKAATEALEEVAQQIRYVAKDLSADQIESMFTQTEAEIQLHSTQDNTSLKNDLDRIKSMIVDVKTGTASSTYDSGLGIDLSGLLDISIDSASFDLSSLFGGTTANTSSISNQRGEQLFKTATARCKTAVLNECQAQGVDISLIANSYDLEIDKQCIAYERSLTDENTQMTQMISNAKRVLQVVRLNVANSKNALGLRECINELDKCMQDDYVCGTGYEYCLDPTGKYIVNGEIAIGSEPGLPGNATTDTTVANLYSTWQYEVGGSTKNAWNTQGNVSGYIASYIPKSGASYPTSDLDKMANYLHNKIGYVDINGKAYGMCASVLNQCQDYTYSDSGNNKKYNPGNDVIRSYLERTLVQIKSAQDTLLSKHAEKCVTDVATCLSQNNYNYGTTSLSNIGSGTNNVAIQACMSEILTCKSVTENNADTSSVYDWLNSALALTTPAQQKCTNSGGKWIETTTGRETTGSCECPIGTNTDKTGACTPPSSCTDNGTWDYVNATCKCSKSQYYWSFTNTQCVSLSSLSKTDCLKNNLAYHDNTCKTIAAANKAAGCSNQTYWSIEEMLCAVTDMLSRTSCIANGLKLNEDGVCTN